MSIPLENVPIKEGEIIRLIANLQIEIKESQMVQSTLLQKLGPVLAPDYPQGEAGEPKCLTATQLGESLVGILESMQNIRKMYSYITDRVEL